MPQAPPRACKCGAVIPSGQRCSRCTKATDERRGTSTERGYSNGWLIIRRRALIRDQFKCIDCGWEPDIIQMYRNIGITDELPPADAIFDELRIRKLRNERHLHADHIETIEGRPELRLDETNLATRCNACHSVRTAKENHGFGR